MSGIKETVVLKSDVMQTLTNHADFHTFVSDDAYQKLLSDLDALLTFNMTVKTYSEHYCKDCKHQYHCGSTSDCLMTCAEFEPTDENPIAKEIYDNVNHPAHYTSGGIECIDCIKAALGENFIGFLIGNVIKYSYRYKDKNGIEDLKKAKWYLERAIKEVSEDAGSKTD